jgi:hypothetical protein
LKTVHKKNIDVRKIAKDIKRLNAKVGFFDTATYEDGIPVAQVAMIQEYGAPQKNIPPRPFMRPAKENNQKTWKKTFTYGINQSFKTGDFKQAFNLVGMQAQSDIKTAIKNVTTPALAESTKKARLTGKVKNAKTATKPLVDTGYMLASVEYEVSQ